MQRKVLSLITAIVLLSAATNALASGWILWQGGTSNDWNNAANWVLTDGTAAGRVPDQTDQVGIGSFKTTYWPTVYNSLTGDDAFAEIFCMSEWHGVYSELTIDGGTFYEPADKYFIVGRHTDDIANVTIKSGGISHTRFLRIGSGDGGDGGGLTDFTMETGVINADAVSVGEGTGAVGATVVIQSGVVDLGYDFWDPSFKIGAAGSMELQGDTVMSFLGYAPTSPLYGYDNWTAARVDLVGNLNIASFDVDIILNEYLGTIDDVLDYLGYTDGGGVFHQGNLTVFGAPATASNLIITTLGPDATRIEGIPEPATICLLGLGGLALIRRKS